MSISLHQGSLEECQSPIKNVTALLLLGHGPVIIEMGTLCGGGVF